MFQKQVSLTFMFFARIETRYVVLGLRPESETFTTCLSKEYEFANDTRYKDFKNLSWCIHLFIFVYICLNLFIFVYICLYLYVS